MRTKILLLFFTINFINLFAQVDGTWDNSFDIGSGANGIIQVVRELPNGKIIIAGEFTEYDGQAVSQIARLNHDGSLDTTFSPPFIAAQITDVLIDGDKMLVAGYEVGARRLNADGSLDTSFSSDLVHSQKIAKQGNKYIITGTSAIDSNGNYYSGMLRLNNDGSLDETFTNTNFNVGTGNNSGVIIVNKTVVLSDGKLLVLGRFGFYNGAAANNVVRLNADGSMDSTFIIPTGKIWGAVNDALELPGGGYIITGSFVYLIGTQQRAFTAKLDATGDFNPDFFIPWQYHILGMSLALQNNGNILVAGWANGNNNYYRLVRLLPSGSADPEFDLSGEFTPNGIECISLQDNYKILVAGRFTMFNNFGRNRLARLNNDDKLGLNNFSEASIVAYPNPTDGLIFLKSSEVFENIAVKIFNIEGRLLYEGSVLTEDTINMERFESGTYILEVSSENKKSIHHIIKS